MQMKCWVCVAVVVSLIALALVKPVLASEGGVMEYNTTEIVNLFGMCSVNGVPCGHSISCNSTIYFPNSTVYNLTSFVYLSPGWFNRTIGALNVLGDWRYDMNCTDGVHTAMDGDLFRIVANHSTDYYFNMTALLAQITGNQSYYFPQWQSNWSQLDYNMSNINLSLQYILQNFTSVWAYFNCTGLGAGNSICGNLSTFNLSLSGISSNLSMINSTIIQINTTVNQINYTINGISVNISQIESNITAYFPSWNATFFFWNNSYFIQWNGSIMNISNGSLSLIDLQNYFNCANNPNQICSYLSMAATKDDVSQAKSNIKSVIISQTSNSNSQASFIASFWASWLGKGLLIVAGISILILIIWGLRKAFRKEPEAEWEGETHE